MRRTGVVLLLLTAPSFAQNLVFPGQLARLQHEFQPQPGDKPLRCEVTSLSPVLNFAFRYQAGYIFHIPQAQYPGPVRGWSELTAITPDVPDAKPTYLIARQSLADAARSDLNFDINGIYFLGEGGYSVDSILRDDRNRVCHKQWHIVVSPKRADRPAQSALPPETVRPYTGSIGPETRHIDAATPRRLTILLNAAVFSTRRLSIRPIDRVVMAGALASILEHVPATSVRLVVFSLEQQREIFRGDDFSLSQLNKVAEAFNTLDLTTVNVSVLQKRTGHLDLLAHLVNSELDGPSPPDTVVFLGPLSRYDEKVPTEELHDRKGAAPQFFYVQYQPSRRVIPSAAPDPPSGGRGGRSGGLGGPGGPDGGTPDASQGGEPPPIPRIPNNGGASSNGSPPPGENGSNGQANGANGTSGGGVASGRGGAARAARNPPPIPVQQGETVRDIITGVVHHFKGKTLTIHSPAELAKAIRKIER